MMARPNVHHPLKKVRQYDFRLSEEEQTRLKILGFVVSERQSAKSFAEIYYRLYTDDMPVFVTSDSVLHAWHRSFDTFLVELEENQVVPLLDDILTRTSAECQKLFQSDLPDDTRQAVLDIDAMISIARSLLYGEEEEDDADSSEDNIWALFQPKETPVPTKLAKDVESLPSNQERVAQMIALAKKQQVASIHFFTGEEPREIDFSQFIPRGHYTKLAVPRKYFRAVMWLGKLDFRIDGGDRSR